MFYNLGARNIKVSFIEENISSTANSKDSSPAQPDPSSLGALWIAKDPSFHQMDSKTMIKLHK